MRAPNEPINLMILPDHPVQGRNVFIPVIRCSSSFPNLWSSSSHCKVFYDY